MQARHGHLVSRSGWLILIFGFSVVWSPIRVLLIFRSDSFFSFRVPVVTYVWTPKNLLLMKLKTILKMYKLYKNLIKIS